ncbi:MAG: flagellar hook-basal body complex protein FliE [Thioalkalispiraceae bacterium]|jgi:flagellar hook-basal body complex protein FliE
MANNTITPDTILAQMRAMAAQAQGATLNTNETAQSDFSNLLKQSIDKVNETQMEAKNLQDAFQLGDPNVQMSEVMVAMQKSSVSFQAMIQVRNKLVQAYQDVMNMPV